MFKGYKYVIQYEKDNIEREIILLSIPAKSKTIARHICLHLIPVFDGPTSINTYSTSTPLTHCEYSYNYCRLALDNSVEENVDFYFVNIFTGNSVQKI